MPGLAASSKIFERIVLDANRYKVVFLEWDLPLKNETLEAYSYRFAQNHIKHVNPVLIGVSFGGILVQEIAAHISVSKLIIISSVKSNQEFPLRMRWSKKLSLNKAFPTGLARHLDRLTTFQFSKKIKQRIKMYQMYLSVSDKQYLDWSFDVILNWKRITSLKEIIHIHGEKDGVFPLRYIKKQSCIIVPNGTHIMILNRYQWLNENLPQIIG